MSNLDEVTVTDQEWEDYKKKFEKAYADPEEEKMRRGIYTETKKRVEEHNKKYEAGEVTFVCGINDMSDKRKDEIRRGRGCRTENKPE